MKYVGTRLIMHYPTTINNDQALPAVFFGLFDPMDPSKNQTHSPGRQKEQ